MKNVLIATLIFFASHCFGQNEQLAQNYFDRGDFEKALINFEELVKSQPNNFVFFQRQVDCYQQLSLFEKAEKAIQTRLSTFNQPGLLVELGYNYQLQKNALKGKIR